MFCLQRYWSLAELKQHITEHHTAPSSPLHPQVPPSPTTSEEGGQQQQQQQNNNNSDSTSPLSLLPQPSSRSDDAAEVRQEESEGSDFISNLLGTRRAVVDRLLTSKSPADDAAKLLGVR